MRRLLILVLIAGISLSVSAQIPFLYQYSMNDGLPSERIFCTVQDKRGFIWFGSDAGLSIFNGNEFYTFTEKQGMASNEVRKLYSDSKNRLWIFHKDGRLTLYDGRTFLNRTSSPMVARIENNKPVATLIEDMFGNIWFGYREGSLARLSSSGSVVYFASPMQGEVNYAPEFYITSDNELWVIYSSRFFNYDYESDEFVLLVGPVIRSADDRLIYHFISNSNAVFLSAKGIERMINKNYGVVISAQRIPIHHHSSSLFYDHTNSIWISNQLNKTLLFRYDKGVYRQGEFLLDNLAVTSFFSDGENNVWVTTDGAGVFRFSHFSLTSDYYSQRNGLPSDNIIRLLPLGNEWLAITSRGEAVHVSNDKPTVIIPLAADGSKELKAASDPAGHSALFAREDELMIYRNLNMRNYRISALLPLVQKPSALTSLTFAGNDRYLAAADSVIFLISLKKGFPEVSVYFNMSRTGGAEQIKSVGNDSLLILSGNSIYLLDPKKELHRLTNKISHPVSDFHLYNGSILAGTLGGGLMIYDNGQLIKTISKLSNVPMNFVNRISLSNENVIWISANTGVFRFLLNKGEAQPAEHFSSVDGLLSDAVHDILISNRIYIAGFKGINYFEGNLIKQITEPPSVFINIFKYGETEIPLSDTMRFKYSRNPLHIEFESPVYHHPGHVRYQYKLNGFNEEWTQTENDFAEYSSLDPGSYIFQVQAKRANSGWSKPVFVKFEIIAPFYGTLWFRLLVANTLVFILYILLRNIVSAKFRKRLAVYERERALEQERNRISRDMHDDLGADLTNIVILSKIARQTIKPQAHERDAIDKIENAANDVINKMNEIIWALNPSNDTLSNLVSYLHRYIKEHLELSQIDFDVSLPARVPNFHLQAGFRRNIFLVVKESIHNVIKHSRASHVKIVISPNGNKTLRISISDNGTGFNVTERTGMGNGLLNMKKRMNEINGIYEIQSAPGQGTTVKIEAPLPV